MEASELWGAEGAAQMLWWSSPDPAGGCFTSRFSFNPDISYCETLGVSTNPEHQRNIADYRHFTSLIAASRNAALSWKMRADCS